MPLQIKKTVQQMVDEANSQIETVSVAEAMKLVGKPGTTFIDIRDPRELWRDGTIPGAINVTSAPDSANSAPMKPPIAPAPNTQIRIHHLPLAPS